MLIDFDLLKLFGNPTYNIANPIQREFNSKDTSAVQTYINAQYDYLVEHKWPERLAALKANWNVADAEAVD